MRFGLVGTGPWAHQVHGPGLASAPGTELVGVWGRDTEKARTLSEELGARPFADYAALLAEVDAVAFAVPPDVQAGMAVEAVRAGKHLLLEKPVATDLGAARRLAALVQEQGVASVVFFTDRFAEAGTWMEETRRAGGWTGGSLRWLAALATPGNPYAGSAWRWERGALWDIGPHALSMLTATLGPITELEAVGGVGDLVHLVLTHDSGATSTATLSLQVPAGAEDHEVVLWGERGLVRMPPRAGDNATVAYGAAVARLSAAAEGADNPVDVHFGVHVVELLHRAEQMLRTSHEAG